MRVKEATNGNSVIYTKLLAILVHISAFDVDDYGR